MMNIDQNCNQRLASKLQAKICTHAYNSAWYKRNNVLTKIGKNASGKTFLNHNSKCNNRQKGESDETLLKVEIRRLKKEASVLPPRRSLRSGYFTAKTRGGQDRVALRMLKELKRSRWEPPVSPYNLIQGFFGSIFPIIFVDFVDEFDNLII